MIRSLARWKSLGRIGAIAGVVLACDIVGPRPVCACSPVPPAVAVINGQVIDPDGHPVESSRVSAHLVSDAPCPAPPATLATPLISTTGGTGQFRYALGWSGGAIKCWALWAAPATSGGLAASDTVLVVVSYTAYPGDSIRVQLRLR